MPELLHTLRELVIQLTALLGQLLALGLQYFLVLVFFAVVLLGIRWRNVWPTLRDGGWAPLVLLMLMAALVWTSLAPLGAWSYVWHLLAVTLIVGIAFFCGWLQELLHWTPPEISFEPPASTAQEHHH